MPSWNDPSQLASGPTLSFRLQLWTRSGGVTGGRDLQATQAYPDRYGQELLRVWRRHKRTKASHWPADDVSEDSDEFEEDAWHDTNMEALVRKKKVSLHKMPC